MGAPIGQIFAGSSGNVANAPAVVTTPATLNKTTYLTSCKMTAAGATAASVVVATISGVIGGPVSYIFAAPAGATVGAAPLILMFDSPLTATGPNTPIVCTLPALGAGNTNAALSISGYIL